MLALGRDAGEGPGAAAVVVDRGERLGGFLFFFGSGPKVDGEIEARPAPLPALYKTVLKQLDKATNIQKQKRKKGKKLCLPQKCSYEKIRNVPRDDSIFAIFKRKIQTSDLERKKNNPDERSGKKIKIKSRIETWTGKKTHAFSL